LREKALSGEKKHENSQIFRNSVKNRLQGEGASVIEPALNP
jgi:hypothetical protein